METVLLTHVWNDELYLPFWIAHHKKLFDQGVIVYYESSDRTLEIIKDLAPEWKIVKPLQPDFSSAGCDRHIEGLECSFPNAWKCCLTVTEYLLSGDLKADLAEFESEHPDKLGFFFSGWGLVDRPEERKMVLDPNTPIFSQRFNGFNMQEFCPPERYGGRRMIHKMIYGGYTIGRHKTYAPEDYYLEHSEQLHLARCFFTPFDEAGKNRKLNIQNNMSEFDKSQGFGRQHYITGEQLETKYQEMLKHSSDLRENSAYANVLKKISTPSS